MSRRKGLSFEEKRSKMLEIFYESKDFFQLKELEKIAPKEKGIVAQSVKEVVQSLVDDTLVDTDKIGTCVYFWAFPSKSSSILNQKKINLESELKSEESKLEEVSADIEKAKIGREEGEERDEALIQLQTNKARQIELNKLLQQYTDNNPETIKQHQKEAKMGLEAANRWTENIFSIKSWCKNKFFIEDNVLNKQFGISEDLDYIEM